MKKILFFHIFLLALVLSCVSTETPDPEKTQPEEPVKSEEVKKEGKTEEVGKTEVDTKYNDVFTLSGPDENCRVEVVLGNISKQCFYSVFYNNNVMLERSPLGITRSDQDFTQNLSVQTVSAVQSVSDNYQLRHGKRKDCRYNANKRTISLNNENGKTAGIEFQVSDNGICFRYIFPESSSVKSSVTSEATGFAFPADTTVFMTPMGIARTGWAETQPSYEDFYVYGRKAGSSSSSAAGWCFPALFKINENGWVLISETLTHVNYCAGHLAQHSPDRTYKIAFPQPREYYLTDPVEPEISFPFYSPWRVIMVGNSLKPIVESTLITDLADPAAVNDSFVRPGHSSWSWLQLKDSATIFSVQRDFIDLSARMGWEYCLIDALWDKQIGYDRIRELVDYAKDLGVGIFLWYNSAGSWNKAPQTPKNIIHDELKRRDEFARLQQMGVKGVKVDFFGGDKQTSIQYYFDIFTDAAKYDLMVNCHGATIPRGWERTFPNLMCTEAVNGMEMVTFDQNTGNRQPRHCAVLPFTRNVIGPMDFTPVIFNSRAGASVRSTTPGYELALSVVFESGIQHFGLTPKEINAQPDYIEDFFVHLPPSWDDILFLDGYPGKYIILARQYNNKWWIGGINGLSKAKDVSLDLSFIGNILKGLMITDNDTSDGFRKDTISITDTRSFNISIQPKAGFVIVAQ